VAGFWSRLKRAEFRSPAAFEVEMADRNDPNRHFIGLLRLRGLEWKLAALSVRTVAGAAPSEDETPEDVTPEEEPAEGAAAQDEAG
jgi:hypothetical protein